MNFYNILADSTSPLCLSDGMHSGWNGLRKSVQNLMIHGVPAWFDSFSQSIVFSHDFSHDWLFQSSNATFKMLDGVEVRWLLKVHDSRDLLGVFRSSGSSRSDFTRCVRPCMHTKMWKYNLQLIGQPLNPRNDLFCVIWQIFGPGCIQNLQSARFSSFSLDYNGRTCTDE